MMKLIYRMHDADMPKGTTSFTKTIHIRSC